MGTNYFRRDTRDTRFVLFECLDTERLLSYEPYREFEPEDFSMMIEEATKVCRDYLGPANQDGDLQGCTFKDGQVTVPESFHDCWRVMAENGWVGFYNSPEFGGQGVPATVTGLLLEMFNAANMAFMIYPGLAAGNGHLIENFGTDRDKALFVEKMYSGQWGATMCLTEPDAGSDVGWLRTKAVPDPESDDPRIYSIQGTKRFISGGNHDLTENIIHLVLARIEGSPRGTGGISLFIVPKIRVNPDGTLGDYNDVVCTNIEHKMGINGSATCGMSFGENNGCKGILLGEPNSGMAKMFQMINEARMGCGLQALGQASAAYDVAVAYARDRVQGPPITNRDGERVPIIQHEDVRRLLMRLKAGTEAMRGMIAKVNEMHEASLHDPDEAVRNRAESLNGLMAPMVKGYFADFSYQLIRDAIQSMGGVGFCRDFPVEQYARDVKGVSIWEGTTYIQSLDLVGRKLPMEGGKIFQEWIQGIMDFTGQHKDDPDFAPDFKLLFKAAAATGEFAMKFMQYFQAGKLNQVALNSTSFLECCAESFMARTILEQGLIARDKLKGIDPGSADGIFYRGKMESARFFCRNILTNVFGRHTSLQQDDTSALDIPEEAFL